MTLSVSFVMVTIGIHHVRADLQVCAVHHVSPCLIVEEGDLALVLGGLALVLGGLQGLDWGLYGATCPLITGGC